MSRWVLQISAGTGPQEVRRFVALLADRLHAEALALGLRPLGRSVRGAAGAPGSVELELQGDAPSLLRAWLGTHELVARSPSRGRAARKRWYAAVGLHPKEEPDAGPTELDPRDVEFRTSRAGGPGGQHVNKTESAVRAVHRPTGLSVRVTGERSQHANRRAALLRLAQMLEERRSSSAAQLRSGRRHAHYLLVRGAPVRRWRLDAANGALCPEGG